MPYEFTTQYARNENDFYVEPPWSVKALINKCPFEGSIHDPACGIGTIPKTFAAAGFKVSGSDIKDRGYGTQQNFFNDENTYENIVCNPPYLLTEAFIAKARRICTGRIAILVRIAFLNGQRRYKLYESFKPEFIVILSRRPSMPPGGMGIYPQGGKTDFCWIVWNANGATDTRAHWSL